MRAPEALALGLLHGPAELLPVSSSGHMALLGREPHGGVVLAMHAGTGLALLSAAWPLRLGLQLGAGIPPMLAGIAFSSRKRPEPSRRALAAGMVAGALALALADRAPQERTGEEITLLDAAVLGFAQACALFPGVSRSGATLSAARARRFRRADAAELSVEVGVPLLLGAAAFTAATRGRDGSGSEMVTGPAAAPLLAAAVASFAATIVSKPLLRALHKPLWPWSAYRAGIALALLRASGR